MAESFGVEDRGHFYDPVGALQDVVVNHLMQLLAAAAMEAPAGDDAATLKDAKYALFRSMPDADSQHYVRGQHDGYLNIDGVAPDSTTETYAALRLEIDNWRWAGVPWFIRTGKRLPTTQTEVRLVFKRPPRLGFLSSAGRRPPIQSQLIVKLDPITGVRLIVDAHRADRAGPRGDHARHGVRAGGRRGAHAVRGPPERGDEGRQLSVHAPGQRRGDVADPASADRASTTRAPICAGYLGTEGGRRVARRRWRLAGTVGGVMSATDKQQAKKDGRGKAPKQEPVEIQSAAAPSPFPPIADYAFLSDCHTGALLAPDGSIDWLCVPRFDSPSVFGTLLDREAGLFRLAPFGTTVPSARYYEPGTNVMITTWKTPQGWAEVRDGLTMGPTGSEDTVTPHTRPPNDEDADHMLVRTVRCLEGEVQIELVCEPAFDYGRTPAEWTLIEGSRHKADATGAGQTIRLHTDLELGIEVNRVRARHTLKPGEMVFAALSWEDDLRGPSTAAEATAKLDATVRFWRRWIGRARPFADHRWRESIQRSALTIKGLTYMPTGATVAALTTSLPETPGGERNWDYRYTWMRDSTFTLQALHLCGLDWEADEFMQFVADVEPNERRRAADHVRDRRPARPHRVVPRGALRVRRARAPCESATAP